MNAIGSRECLNKLAKTLDEHWSDRRIFALIMVCATRLKARRVALSLGVKRGGGRQIGQSAKIRKRSGHCFPENGWHERKAASCDRCARQADPLLPLPAQVGDHTGGAALLDSLPQSDRLVADREYDAEWLRKRRKSVG